MRFEHEPFLGLSGFHSYQLLSSIIEGYYDFGDDRDEGFCDEIVLE